MNNLFCGGVTMGGEMKDPCKDCADRHPNCHARCPKYQEFRAQREQIYNARVERSDTCDFYFSVRKRLRKELP